MFLFNPLTTANAVVSSWKFDLFIVLDLSPKLVEIPPLKRLKSCSPSLQLFDKFNNHLYQHVDQKMFVLHISKFVTPPTLLILYLSASSLKRLFQSTVPNNTVRSNISTEFCPWQFNINLCNSSHVEQLRRNHNNVQQKHCTVLSVILKNINIHKHSQFEMGVSSLGIAFLVCLYNINN